MTVKLVIRLLTAENTLLGWVVHEAAVRGDGHLRAAGQVAMPIAYSGVPACVSVHWCDVHVETRVPWTRGPVQAGLLVGLYQADDPIMVCGRTPGPLPPVSVGSVAIGVGLGVAPGQL